MAGGAPSGDADPESAPFLPRWVMWLALPATIMPGAIFLFVLATESAHDAERCPFVQTERRDLAPGVSVLEERRSCVADVEERRWTLVRDGRSRVLGSRRLDPEAFEARNYRWTADLSPAGEVRAVVENAGHGQVTFREGTPEERQRDGR